MNRLIFLILILLTVLTDMAAAQQWLSPNNFNSEGRKHGLWTLFFDGNWKRVESPSQARFYRIIDYSDGKPTGTVRDYYISGAIQWEGIILVEEPEITHGPVTYYYENGQKSSAGHKHYDKYEGEWTSWFEDGRIESTGRYVNGLRDGFWIEWTKEGKRSEGQIRNDEITGPWTFYDTDGSLLGTGYYRGGKPDGFWQ